MSCQEDNRDFAGCGWREIVRRGGI